MNDIILIIVMLMLLCFISIVHQSWISPAAINIIINLFFIFFAVVVLGNDLQWNYSGIWWLIISCFMFLLGQTIGTKIQFQKNYELYTYKTNIHSNLVYPAILVITVVALGLPIITILIYGYRLIDLLDLSNVLEINTVIAQKRYGEGALSLGILGNILLVVSYFVSLMGGYAFALTQKIKEKMICIFTIFPLLINMLITNTKSSLIAAVFLWISGFMVADLNKKGRYNTVPMKMIKRIVLAGLIVLVLLDLSMMMRIGEISKYTQEIVFDKLETYAFGHIYSFSYWFAHMDEVTYDMGMNTFMTFTNWLGITTREIGVYDRIGDVVSNVYTQNRGIIMDFGIIGGQIYWLYMGLLTGILYNRVCNTQYRETIINKVFLSAIYFSVFYGFIISPWIYSSYTLAFIIFGIALLLIRYFKVQIKYG